MTRELPGWFWALVAVAAVKTVAGVPGLGLPIAAAGPASPFPPWVYLIGLVVYASIGVVLLLGGRRDRRALLLGGAFMLAASMAADRGLARLEAHGPPAMAYAAAVLAALDPGAFRALLVWTFARAFPRPALTGSWRLVATLGQTASAVAGVAIFGISLWTAANVMNGGTTPMPAFLLPLTPTAESGVYWMIVTPLTLAGLPLIVLNTRAAGRSDQRRAELFVAGLVTGTAPILAQAAAELLIAPYGQFMSQAVPRFWSGVVLYPLLYCGLAVAAYAVYMGRALSVRLVVRSAVRYAFARATLTGLILVPFLLLSYVVFQNRHAPLDTLLGGPPQLALLALTAAGGWLLSVRRPLLTWLDRRFFREQYDARRILARLIDSARSASSITSLADQLTSEIDRALHVTRARVYVHDARANALCPADGSGPPLPAGSTLATLLKGSDIPMDVAGTNGDGALARLPAAERAWASEGAFRLLVPINDGQGKLAGVIALGEKKSELPFSREDRWLLASTASSAALAIEWLRARSAASSTPHASPQEDQDPAHECPRCDTLHSPSTAVCPTCGETLREAAVPLTIRGLRMERRIGTGGMGVVYCATDPALRRQVAVKTLPALSPSHAGQLRREAQAMAALSHPNLATIFAADVWRGTPVLVVEFLHGGTLQDRIRQGPLDTRYVLDIGAALAGALEHMHGRSILHRDIKPSNIGFAAAGTPKLLDFGLAKILVGASASRDGVSAEATTSTSGIPGSASVDLLIGTPAYFSPELAALQPPDYSSDLWALTLSLYEAISGTNPMAGVSPLQTLERIATATVPALDTVRADCPAIVAAGFARALGQNPGDRPRSAKELREELVRMKNA